MPLPQKNIASSLCTVFLLILVLVFSYTGMIKFIDPVSFASAMYSQPFSETLTWLLIHLVPTAEIATALLLVFHRTRLAGIACAIIQLLLFTTYTIMVLLGYYPTVPCPCGGFIQDLSWQQHLFMNIVLLCMAIITLVLHRFVLIQKISMDTGNAENLSKLRRHHLKQ